MNGINKELSCQILRPMTAMPPPALVTNQPMSMPAWPTCRFWVFVCVQPDHPVLSVYVCYKLIKHRATVWPKDEQMELSE